MSALKKVLFLMLLIGFTACNKKTSVIKGVVKNCEGCTVTLDYYNYAQMIDQGIRQTTVKDGRFSFSVNADSIPREGVYGLTMVLPEDNLYRNMNLKQLDFPIYLPADSVNINMDPAGLPEKKSYPFRTNPNARFHLVDIKSSSPVQKELDFYIRMRDSMDVKFNNRNNLVRTFFSQAIESSNKKEIDKWADTLNHGNGTGSQYRPKAADAFIKKYPDSELVPYVLLENYDYRSVAPRFRKYYKTFSPELQNSYYGKILDTRLAGYEKRNTKYAKHIVGAEITYLVGRTPQGDTLQESKIFKKNKLTFVNFWASWCDSCRMQTPTHRQLYKTYKDKGFEIISFSLDVNGGDWQKAIQKDQMQWYHLTEMNEGNSGEVLRFRLYGIPANVLINQEGKIVASNITPQQLQEKLKAQL